MAEQISTLLGVGRHLELPFLFVYFVQENVAIVKCLGGQNPNKLDSSATNSVTLIYYKLHCSLLSTNQIPETTF